MYTYHTQCGLALSTLIKKSFVYSRKMQQEMAISATIVPRHLQKVGGVYDANDKLIETSIDYNYLNQDAEPSLKWNIEEESDAFVVYMGCVDDNWGFLFVECINRLWAILEHPQQYKIAFCGGDEKNGTFGQHSKRFLELCSWLGINSNQFIHINKVTRFKQVIVPDRSFFHIEVPTYGKQTPLKYMEFINQEMLGKPCYYWTAEYTAICKTISRNCVMDLPKYEKIYFSRTRLKQNKEIGEKPIESIFRQNGYQILYPEQLSISEQIWYIKNCRVFASIEGTLAHNVIFASNKLEKQIILRKQSEIIPRQVMLNQVVGVPIVYVDVYEEPFPHFPISHSKGPFRLSINDNFIAFGRDEGMNTNAHYCRIGDSCKYTLRCIKAGLEKQAKKIVTLIHE